MVVADPADDVDGGGGGVEIGGSVVVTAGVGLAGGGKLSGLMTNQTLLTKTGHADFLVLV
jgi:hypothetical protein